MENARQMMVGPSEHLGTSVSAPALPLNAASHKPRRASLSSGKIRFLTIRG